MSERPRLRVLAVDDEPFNREAIVAMLETIGHKVMCASNGREALDMLLAAPRAYDLVLMDVIMPVMSGLEAIQLLRQHDELRTLPVLCISAKASGASQFDAVGAGADSFLSKPFRRRDLIDAVDALLRKRGIIGADVSIA